jgi:hypothetical protein
VVALSTEGEVSFVTADNHLLVVGSIATIGEGGRRSIGTSMAEGRETFHAVGEGNALEQLSEGSTIRVSVQTYEREVLSKGVDDPFDKRHEACEKLSLIDEDDVVSNDVLGNQVMEVANCDTGGIPPVVGRNVVATIADIVGVLDDENIRAQGRIARHKT